MPGKEHWNLNFAECKPAWCCVVFKPRSKREQIFTNIVLKTTRGSSCWPYGPFGTLIWSVLAIETGCFAPSFFLFLNLLSPSALNHFLPFHEIFIQIMERLSGHPAIGHWHGWPVGLVVTVSALWGVGIQVRLCRYTAACKYAVRAMPIGLLYTLCQLWAACLPMPYLAQLPQLRLLCHGRLFGRLANGGRCRCEVSVPYGMALAWHIKPR